MIPQTVTVSEITASGKRHDSYMDWPAIFAGLVFASAISIVLLTFGSAIGFSYSGKASGEAFSLAAVVAAVSYVLWVQISSFMAGAYLTGRMRHRHYDATEHEVDVRDGAHGLVVWAGAVLLAAYLATSGIGAALNAAGNVANASVSVATANPGAYFTDLLLRSDSNETSPQRVDEVSRILAKTVTGAMSQADQDYLALLVSKQTGITPAEATLRVTDVLSQADAAKAEAARLAERARKTAVLSAFLAAAALLVGAAAAYWAAGVGGNHRDDGVVFDRWFSRRRTIAVAK